MARKHVKVKKKRKSRKKNPLSRSERYAGTDHYSSRMMIYRETREKIGELAKVFNERKEELEADLPPHQRTQRIYKADVVTLAVDGLYEREMN